MCVRGDVSVFASDTTLFVLFKLLKNHQTCVLFLLKMCMIVFSFVCLDKAHRPGV